MATPLAVRSFEHFFVQYRRVWRGTAFFSFVNPVLFLAAMGVGLGTLVGTQDSLGGVPYKDFVAPGVLCASAMQLGVNEAMWPVMGALKWQRTYFAQIAAPLRPDDAALGHLLFMAFRVAIASVAFTVVMALFGTIHSAWAALAPLVAIVCGMAHTVPVCAFSATRQSEGTAFSGINRFVVTPLFLFGGTFFPVDQLPAALRPIAWVTPLWHGVELTRSLTLGTVEAGPAVVHLAVMAAWMLAGYVAAVRVYRWRLAT